MNPDHWSPNRWWCPECLDTFEQEPSCPEQTYYVEDGFPLSYAKVTCPSCKRTLIAYEAAYFEHEAKCFIDMRATETLYDSKWHAPSEPVGSYRAYLHHRQRLSGG